jgi:hypothetical protein
MQITLLSSFYPYPADNGAKMRVLALIRALAREHCVDLVMLGADQRVAEDSGPLHQLCRSITSIPVPLFSPGHGASWRGLFTAMPRSIHATYNPAVTAFLEEQIAARTCDAVIAECLGD